MKIHKPKKVKQANGEYRPCRVNYDEPNYDRNGSIPCPPQWLDDLDKDEWKRLAPFLIQNDLLKETDKAEFDLYCQSYADYVRATNTIESEGHYKRTQNG